MNKTKCIICKKRYAGSQEWKTSREKELCFSCYVVEEFISKTLECLCHFADEKGLSFKFTTELKPKNEKTKK